MSDLPEPPATDDFEVVNMVTPAGEVVSMPYHLAMRKVSEEGYRPETYGEALARQIAIQREERQERVYGDRPLTAAALGLAGIVTGGASNLAARALGYEEEVREITGRSPFAAAAGEIGGFVSPVGAGALAVRAGAKVGGAVTAKLGTGLAGRLAAKTAAGATEGLGIGAIHGVEELALSDEPITAERVVSVLPSAALHGALVGGAIGGGAEVATTGGKALGRAGMKVKKWATGEAAREALPAHLIEVRKIIQEANPFLAANGVDRRVLSDTNKALDKALNNPADIVRYPKQILLPLERLLGGPINPGGLRNMLVQTPEKLAAVAKEEARMAKLFGKRIQTAIDRNDKVVTLLGNTKDKARYTDFTGVHSPMAKPLPISLEDAKSFQAAWARGEVKGARARALEKVPGLIEVVDELRLAVKDAIRPRAIPAILGSFPILSPMVGGLAGTLARLPGKIQRYTRLGQVMSGSAASSARASAAVTAILSTGKKATPYVRPALTQVLNDATYSPGPTAPRTPTAPAAGKWREKARDLYRRRASELREATDGGEGTPTMRRPNRDLLASKLLPLLGAKPLLADKVEAVFARRVGYLASQLPKKPEENALLLGPDTWLPSDLAIASFARRVAASEDPIGVIERVADGTITPEDAETLRAVYPELYQEMRMQILEKLSTVRQALPYSRRLALSIFLDMPVDPSMDPSIVRVLQEQFLIEEGTQGGQGPPMAQAQFGSLKKSPLTELTPAQERAG